MLRQANRHAQFESLDPRVMLDASGVIDLQLFIDDLTTASHIARENDTLEYLVEITNNGENATTAATGVHIGVELSGLVGLTAETTKPISDGMEDGSFVVLEPIEPGELVAIRYTAQVNAADGGGAIRFAAAVIQADQTDIDSVPGDFSRGEDDVVTDETDYEPPIPTPSTLLDTDGDGMVELGVEIPNDIPLISASNEWQDLDVTSGPVYFRGDGNIDDYQLAVETTGGIIRVFDEHYQLIGEQTAGAASIIRLPALDIDRTADYLIQISGDEVISTVSIDIATPVTTITDGIFVATQHDDEVELFLGTYEHTLSINGQYHRFRSQVSELHIGGAQGANSITIHGTDLDDTASIIGTNGEFHSSGYSVFTYSFQNITFTGGGGNDYGTLYGTSGDDVFSSLPQDSTMITPDTAFRMTGFERVDGFGRGGNDYASLYGTHGDDLLNSADDFAWIHGAGHLGYAKGFDRVDVFGRGGSNLAKMEGTTSDDVYVSTDVYGMLIQDHMRTYAKGFYAVEVIGNGGTDAAYVSEHSADSFFSEFETEDASIQAYARREGRSEWFEGDFDIFET